MKRLSLLLVSAVVSITAIAVRQSVDVIPHPASVAMSDGYFVIAETLRVTATDSPQLADTFVSYLKMTGLDAVVSLDNSDVTVVRNPQLGEEQYLLSVTPEGISVEASGSRGVFYAAQTLFQLMAASEADSIPSCIIDDYPRMPYRGLMLDVVRCYIAPDDIKRFIDVASRLKINNLHLHLTDDNGWRLEIKRYPRLTEVGAWRVDRPELFPGRLNQRNPGEPTPVGGFYTQDEMRDIVRYAAERHVNIIPEIEMPAHAAAAIASYPGLACPVNDKFVGVFPGIGGTDASIIMCGGNEKVYEFYEGVLDEVMDIFPSELIHLGGDEANKRLWEKCPLCQQKIIDEGLKDCEELQAYFMDRINHYVRSHGRTAIGWDEVTYGNPKEDMVIMGWQGDGSTAVNDSRSTGRRFIMTPAQVMYLIRYQGPQWFEPWTYFGNNRLTDIHSYEPVDSTWTPELRESLIGLQGSLWSEFCSSADDMEYLVMPRLLAVADVAWRPESSADISSFFRGVDNFLPVLDSLDINYARSMWNIQHTARPVGDGRVSVTLECERPDAEIRYSFGDSLRLTETYSSPLILSSDSIIYAATYRDGRREGRMLELPVRFNLATGRDVSSPECRNGLTDVLTNGVRGSLRNSDFEWAGWWNSPGEFTVDLGERQSVDSVSLGVLVNSDICVAAPLSLSLSASSDGENFTHVKDFVFSQDVIFAHPARSVEAVFPDVGLDGVRYLRVTAVNPGPVPVGMARESSPTWLYFDEIIVR